MITTTLARIRKHSPCKDGWEKLLAGLGKTKADDDSLSFARIVEINGLDDALWCCRAEPQHAKEWRLFGVWCARQVRHLMTDQRSLDALDCAERHANGLATDEKLSAAADAARAAVRVVTRVVVRDTTWVVVRDAARGVVRVGERDASWAAVRAAAWGVVAGAAWAAARGAAWDAAEAAAWAAAWDGSWDVAATEDAARAVQKIEFIKIVGAGK